VKHGQDHLIATIRGCGEREAESGDQRRLYDAETVVTPTGVGIVIRYTVI
jgi:hypothetical protein